MFEELAASRGRGGREIGEGKRVSRGCAEGIGRTGPHERVGAASTKSGRIDVGRCRAADEHPNVGAAEWDCDPGRPGGIGCQLLDARHTGSDPAVAEHLAAAGRRGAARPLKGGIAGDAGRTACQRRAVSVSKNACGQVDIVRCSIVIDRAAAGAGHAGVARILRRTRFSKRWRWGRGRREIDVETVSGSPAEVVTTGEFEGAGIQQERIADAVCTIARAVVGKLSGLDDLVVDEKFVIDRALDAHRDRKRQVCGHRDRALAVGDGAAMRVFEAARGEVDVHQTCQQGPRLESFKVTGQRRSRPSPSLGVIRPGMPPADVPVAIPAVPHHGSLHISMTAACSPQNTAPR